MNKINFQKIKNFSFDNYKAFILLSIAVHLVLILVFINKNDNSETIVVNTDEKSEIIEINEISDEEIFTAMKQIEIEEQEAVVNKKLQAKRGLELKKQLSKIKELEKKEQLIKDKIKNQEKEVIKKNIKIKKLNDEANSLKNHKKDLDKINEKLNKKIELKKKAPKITKKKIYFKKDSNYKKQFSTYINEISYKFRKNWVIPVNAEESWACTVKVVQDNNGKLKDFDIFDNCPADPDFLRSIDRAIKASTPLPSPPPKLDFNDIKEITLEFKMNF